ncbi:hypothetical protein PCAR4_570110 [Paraburkholderia caribensis]|nr:hypothetical protein PCAR4_570110 [Paraburkholderia caribensis]
MRRRCAALRDQPVCDRQAAAGRRGASRLKRRIWFREAQFISVLKAEVSCGLWVKLRGAIEAAYLTNWLASQPADRNDVRADSSEGTIRGSAKAIRASDRARKM